MRKSLFFSLFLTFICIDIFASPVDTTTAKLAATHFLAQHSDASRAAAPLQLSYQLDNAAQQACVYVFNRAGGGFVITSADDHVLPVLGFSVDGEFRTENMPENIAYWLQTYCDAVTDLSAGDRAYPSMAAAWQELLNNELPHPTREAVVFPMLATTWGQSPYYNALCPISSQGQAITGCVATAMGQIMRYWQHPSQGHGHHSYVDNLAEWGYEDYGTLYVDFGAATYDFSLMPEMLYFSSSQAQINEVAKLLYHCGVSVNMMYGTDGSGANSADVPNAMHKYFGYTSSTFYYKGSNENGWINLLKDELDAGRPVYYSGSGDDGGHAFVCDGYNDENYFHFNWGWQGAANGYFAVANLNPSSYEFNELQGAIFGLEPDSCYPYPEIQISGNTVMADANSSVTLIAPAGESYAWTGGGTTQSITVSPTVPKFYTVTVTDSEGCRNTASTWVTFADGCEINCHLHDSYGDGWQGNALQVFNRVTKIAEITLEEGGDTTITLPVIDGELALRWKLGDYPEECSYSVSGHCFEYTQNVITSSGIQLVTQLYCGDIATEFDITTEEPSYTWNDVTYTESGDYTQTFSNHAGCDSTVTLHLNLPAGISDYGDADRLRVYPNPTTGVLNAECDWPNCELRVFDVYGKLLFINKLDKSENRVDLSDCANGIYFLHVFADGTRVATRKVVVER